MVRLMRFFFSSTSSTHTVTTSPHGADLAGVAHPPGGVELGDVDQAVLVDPDVHKDAEVDDIADGAGELHAGL